MYGLYSRAAYDGTRTVYKLCPRQHKILNQSQLKLKAYERKFNFNFIDNLTLHIFILAKV